MQKIGRTSSLPDVGTLDHSPAIRCLAKRQLANDGIFFDYSTTSDTKPISCSRVILNNGSTALGTGSCLHIVVVSVSADAWTR